MSDGLTRGFYEPFGKSWHDAVINIDKERLVDMLRTAYLDKRATDKENEILRSKLKQTQEICYMEG